MRCVKVSSRRYRRAGNRLEAEHDLDYGNDDQAIASAPTRATGDTTATARATATESAVTTRAAYPRSTSSAATAAAGCRPYRVSEHYEALATCARCCKAARNARHLACAGHAAARKVDVSCISPAAARAAHYRDATAAECNCSPDRAGLRAANAARLPNT